MTEKKTEDLCEDLAATMLATTLGIPFEPDKAWDEREQQFKMSGEIVKTRSYVQTAEGDKSGLWTSVISAVVFILEKASQEKPNSTSTTPAATPVPGAAPITNGGPANSHP